MKSLLSINDLSKEEIFNIFESTDKIINKENFDLLKGKRIVLFFPDSSIRTRMSFEFGIKKFGGDIISFPSSTLDKKEKFEDVVGYIENWADAIVIRHSNYNVVKELDRVSKIPVINAMTSTNHPCEIIHDLYAIKNIKENFTELSYLYIGPKTNISTSWYNASQKLGFNLVQVCPEGYEISDRDEKFKVLRDLDDNINKFDVIVTDTILKDKDYIDKYQINNNRVKAMKEDAMFNPTPPFYRGEVVSDDIDLSNKFVGYHFKNTLLEVQVAIIANCLNLNVK